MSSFFSEIIYSSNSPNEGPSEIQSIEKRETFGESESSSDDDGTQGIY